MTIRDLKDNLLGIQGAVIVRKCREDGVYKNLYSDGDCESCFSEKVLDLEVNYIYAVEAYVNGEYKPATILG